MNGLITKYRFLIYSHFMKNMKFTQWQLYLKYGYLVVVSVKLEYLVIWCRNRKKHPQERSPTWSGSVRRPSGTPGPGSKSKCLWMLVNTLEIHGMIRKRNWSIPSMKLDPKDGGVKSPAGWCQFFLYFCPEPWEKMIQFDVYTFSNSLKPPIQNGHSLEKKERKEWGKLKWFGSTTTVLFNCRYCRVLNGGCSREGVTGEP